MLQTLDIICGFRIAGIHRVDSLYQLMSPILEANFFLPLKLPPLSHGGRSWMFSNFFKTNKSTLIKIIAVILFVIVAVQYINIYKRKLFGKLSLIERQLNHLQSSVLENSFVQAGFKLDNGVNFRKSLGGSVFFVGHFILNQCMLTLLRIDIEILNIHYDT